MTRNGKTARLPRVLRDAIDRRLNDGQTHRTILAWLDGLPAGQEFLQMEFEDATAAKPNRIKPNQTESNGSNPVEKIKVTP